MNESDRPVLVARENEAPNRRWREDPSQFARLLSEIRAMGLTPAQYKQLGESMDLKAEEIDELLERAEGQWHREMTSGESASVVYLYDADGSSRFDRRLDVVLADSNVQVRAPFAPDDAVQDAYEPMVAVEYTDGFVRAQLFIPKQTQDGVDMTCEDPEPVTLLGPVTAAQQEAIWRKVQEHNDGELLTAPVFIWLKGTSLDEVRRWFARLRLYALEVFDPTSAG